MVTGAKRAGLALGLALVLGGSVAAQSAPTVPDTAASRYVGQVVTVEGFVATVHKARHFPYTYLNFGYPFPDQTFSAWIPDSLRSQFPGVAELERKRVRVTGKVWLQEGKTPAITLERPEDLVEVRD